MNTAARRSAVLLAMLISIAGASTGKLRAAVVVISNKTDKEVRFAISQLDGPEQSYVLEAFDLTAVPVHTVVQLHYGGGDEKGDYRLRPNSVYYFARESGRLQFSEIDLGAGDAKRSTARTGRVRHDQRGAKPDAVLHIPVKILVDEEEPAARNAWEERLRRRVEQASDVFERYCRVRFDVVATDQWQSDDSMTDFQQSLREFEREVDPSPARLAIGFTSQYEFDGSRLGGTRTLLHSHVLIRERYTSYSAPERLEVLVHELGHFLGAAHSPEPDSVMRPVLADGKSVARSFRIQFDPINALAANLVAEALRDLDTWTPGRLPGDTRAELTRLYTAIDRVFPKDPAARQYLELLSGAQTPIRGTIRLSSSILGSARRVRAAVVQAAERNQQRPTSQRQRVVDAARPFEGDALTEYYVRAAVEVARQLPPGHAAVALPVGLAVALDPSDPESGAFGQINALFETPAERKRRLEVIGAPTLWGRTDLARHFVLSSALSALLGAKAATQVGVAKELADSEGGSGFSLADLSANLSGIAFSELLKQPRARAIADFKVDDFVLDPAGLKEGMTRDEFIALYGSTDDARFRKVLADLRNRVNRLPGYQGSK